MCGMPTKQRRKKLFDISVARFAYFGPLKSICGSSKRSRIKEGGKKKETTATSFPDLEKRQSVMPIFFSLCSFERVVLAHNPFGKWGMPKKQLALHRSGK